MTEEKKGVRSIFELFALHKPIPGIKVGTSASIQDTKIKDAEAKRLRKQQRNIQNEQSSKHNSHLN